MGGMGAHRLRLIQRYFSKKTFRLASQEAYSIEYMNTRGL